MKIKFLKFLQRILKSDFQGINQRDGDSNLCIFALYKMIKTLWGREKYQTVSRNNHVKRIKNFISLEMFSFHFKVEWPFSPMSIILKF